MINIVTNKVIITVHMVLQILFVNIMLAICSFGFVLMNFL